MYELFLALLLACSCPAHNCPIHPNGGGPVITTTNGDDTIPGDDSGGDTGHIPPGPKIPTGL